MKIIIIIVEGHSLLRVCLQPATNTQNSKPRPTAANYVLSVYKSKHRTPAESKIRDYINYVKTRRYPNEQDR